MNTQETQSGCSTPAPGSEDGIHVGELSAREADGWDPFTQNHDPSFIRALRSAYRDGFIRGYYLRGVNPPNDKLTDSRRE